MKQLALILLGLFLPLMALTQSATDLPAQAWDKQRHGDFKGALADYTQAITQNPKDVRAYLGRATVLSLEGNYAGAIADYTKAIALDPKNPVAWSNRGNARMMQGDLTGAMADYTEAIKLDPHHIRAFINRGNIKNIQKKYGEAVKDYTAAIALDPKRAGAYYNRGGAERALGDYAGARTDFSKAIELNPVDAPAYINRAIIEMAQQDWSSATDDLKKCEDLVPEERQAYIHAYLWVIAAKQGAAEKSTAQLTSVVDSVPKPYSDTWGWEIARFLAGQEDEKTFLSSSIAYQTQKNKGQEAQALYFAGRKRALAGDTASAAKFFQQCVKTGNPSLHEYILASEELKPTGGSHP